MSAAWALAAVLAARACAGGDIVGFNVPAWGTRAYDQPQAQSAVAALPATGARWAAVTPTWYVESASSDRIRASERTNSDASLRAAIRRLKALGLKVAVKPHVDVEDGTARGFVSPRHMGPWFDDYTAMSLHYARLAQEEGADMYVVGTELARVATPLHVLRWDRLIARLRGVYHGPMTYAANWYDAPGVPFWRKLDYVGIDAYYPLPGSGVAAFRRGWKAYGVALSLLSAAAGRPIIFTEVGLASVKNANHTPWDYRGRGPLDQQVQADYLQGMLEALQDKKWFAGFWYWAWDLYGRGGPQDTSMSVQGKPALSVLSRYFRTGRAEAMPALGLSAPSARVDALAVPRFE